MSGLRPSALERVRQSRRLLGSEGLDGLLRRFRERAAHRLAPAGCRPLLVDSEDFHALVAAGDDTDRCVPARWVPGEKLTIAWVCVPSSGGSGGHTTMFRMVTALERAGHTCVVYLRDRHGWEIDQHRRMIREWWPWVEAEIRDLADGIEDCDAIVATGWDTAYSVKASGARGVRFYFVQDFEPSFYAAGSAHLLAEATYSFGFHGITAGRWLAQKLATEFAMSCDHFDFGCDLDTYAPPGADLDGPRAGVCYYSRPSSPRRAHELAVFALELFAQRHPDVEIHVYGEATRLPFSATQHGLLTPLELGALYRRTVAGLTLSATNVSLVPHEMLAAGCIPVVNDAVHNRMVLDNDQIVYAAASPVDLADALSRLVARSPAEQATASRSAATSVRETSWSVAAGQVELAFVREVERRSAQSVRDFSLKKGFSM